MSFFGNAAIGGLGAGAIPGFDSFLHPENAYKDAMGQSEKYYQDAQGRLQPFVDNGQARYGQLTGQADALNDPESLWAKWTKGYSMSPTAQLNTQVANDAGMGAAASMGLNGSSSALSNVQNNSSNIMQQDRESYLNHLMQSFMGSVGINQGIYGAGANAAGAQSNNAMNQGNNMAQLQYNASAAPGQLFGQILGKGLNFATGGVG